MMHSKARSRQWLAAGMAAGVLALGAVLPAAAQPQAPQQPTSLQPPRARVSGKPPIVWNILGGVVIGGLILAASLIPSKRGHQD